MNELAPVSVVTPAYNAAKTIGDTLRSLTALDYPPDRLEIIVVDNGSTDATARVLAEFQGRLQVVREPRRGRSQARNAGVRAAKHPVIAFIDADCIASPNWLRRLVPRLDDPAVGAAGGRIAAVRPCNAIEEFGESLHDQSAAIELYKPPYAITANWASRRSVLLEIAFDETLRRCEDCDLSYRMLQAGYRLVYESDALVYQRNRSTMRELAREGFQNGFYSIPVLKKHIALMRAHRHRRFEAWRLWSAMKGLAQTRAEPPQSLPRMRAVFEAAKRAGKVCGSVRFGWLDF